MRRKRADSPAAIRRKLWAAFSKLVKERYGPQCWSCEAQGLEGSNWQAGHLVNASLSAGTKWDPWNVRPQCSRCNIFLRGNIANFTMNFCDRYGTDTFAALIARSRITAHWKVHHLRALLAAASASASAPLLWDSYRLAFRKQWLDATGTKAGEWYVP